MFCYCLCFAIPFVSLLFMFCCCSCFAFHCASLLLLFHCSFCFAIPFVSLFLLLCCYIVFCCSSSYVSLLCSVLRLLCVSLLPCPPKYLFAPCCFVDFKCFVPLPILVLPLSFFCSVLEIWNCLGGSLEASKLTISFFCSSLVFLIFFFGLPYLIYF
jgi:hypothetical protein